MLKGVTKAQLRSLASVVQGYPRHSLVPKKGFATSSTKQSMVTITKDDKTGE
jgi:hypothetical protein